MSRSDRLFSLVGLLRDGQLHTAAGLAQAEGVSVRTIWRDMELLSASGLPIEGTRGQGYRLGGGIPLPPMVLAPLELEALRLGLSTVAEQADPELGLAARAILGRIESALPGHGGPVPASGIGKAPFARAAEGFRHMSLLRRAIGARLLLDLVQALPGEAGLLHRIRPLRMDYLGGFWSLTAWCESCGDFQVFQVDRIDALTDTGQTFPPEPGKRIEDYLAGFAGGPDGN